MDLEKLKKPLTRSQIDFRVQSVRKTTNDVRAVILAYKDARVDMEVLDEAVGAMNWQVKYKRDSQGVLQCAIGIFKEDILGWVWKTSNGTESNIEKEKGEYSDAFKRAGFMWGIGRQLYDFPHIEIILNQDDYYEKNGEVKSKIWPNSWKWTISEDYKSVTAERKISGKLVEVFNSNPYKK